jgi:hypothetical protein
MMISSVFSSISNSFSNFFKASSVNMSFRLSVVLGKQGLKVKVSSSIKPSRFSFLQKAIFKLKGSIQSKESTDLQLYFNELLQIKAKESLTKVDTQTMPLYMQMASFTSVLQGFVTDLDKDGMDDILGQLQDFRMNIDAYRSSSELKIIMDIKAKGNKESLLKGVSALVKSKEDDLELPEIQHAIPIDEASEEPLQKKQSSDGIAKLASVSPTPSAPPMTPEVLAQYNAQALQENIPVATPINYSENNQQSDITKISPISTRAVERESKLDTQEALHFHIEQLQNYMEMFNARINFELLPCIRRLYESIENLAKGSFEIMHEFNKGQEKVKLKSENELRTAHMEISFYNTLKEDGGVLPEFMSNSVVPKSVEFLSSGSRGYTLHEQAMDQMLSEITTSSSYENVVHHLTQARQIINHFNQNGFPEGLGDLYSQWKDIDSKIQHGVNALGSLEHLTAQMDEVVGNPDQTLIPHLQTQLKEQIDHLSGVNPYDDTFQKTFDQQYKANSEVLRPEDIHLD